MLYAYDKEGHNRNGTSRGECCKDRTTFTEDVKLGDAANQPHVREMFLSDKVRHDEKTRHNNDCKQTRTPPNCGVSSRSVRQSAHDFQTANQSIVPVGQRIRGMTE